MRVMAGAAALLLAGCGSATQGAPDAEPDDMIECALAGAGQFVRDCRLERRVVDGGLELVVRHPDGGFRRFDYRTGDTLDLTAADGAEPARVSRPDSSVPWLDVAVGADRYRIPVAYRDAGD